MDGYTEHTPDHFQSRYLIRLTTNQSHTGILSRTVPGLLKITNRINGKFFTEHPLKVLLRIAWMYFHNCLCGLGILGSMKSTIQKRIQSPWKLFSVLSRKRYPALAKQAVRIRFKKAVQWLFLKSSRIDLL